MKCELCKDISCFDQPVVDEIGLVGRLRVHNNGKDMWTEDTPIPVAGCIVRKRHEQKELQRHINNARQNLNKL